MVKISGVSNGTVPIDQPARGTPQAADRAQPGPVQTPTPVQGQEVVSLSGQAQDAAALLKGVAAADQPQASAEVQQLTLQVAAGNYRPPAAKIAGAMLSFERLLARKLGRD